MLREARSVTRSLVAAVRRTSPAAEARTAVSIVRALWRSPLESLAKAREFADRQQFELEVATGTAAPAPVYDDLPGIAWRNVKLGAADPSLDVFVPGLQLRHLSGGPNTALNLTYRLAAAGVPVRFVSTDLPHDDEESLRRHCAGLTGIERRLDDIGFLSLDDRASVTSLGRDDLTFATAWWTAQYAGRLLPQASAARFIYLIQDFEPCFYKWSTEHALALETYGMPMQPVICGHLLADYLRDTGVGRFKDPAFADSSLVFEPAIDRSRFHAGDLGAASAKRRLLFYARPEAPRNLFEIGLLGLRQAVDRGALTADDWEVWFIGGEVPPRDLGRGVVARQHAWLDYDGYAALLRSCDVGLSLMLSPHTSYPPLEMAACGASVVTNTFANKTEERLRAYSENLLPADPSVTSVADRLVAAIERTGDLGARRAGSDVQVPATWADAFLPVVEPLAELWRSHLNALGPTGHGVAG
jgi:hypothetical protein